MNPLPEQAMKRYITRWPADANGQTHWEAILLEISPSKEHVRLLWGYHADGTADQEWVPAKEFAAAIVEELPIMGQPMPVPAPTVNVRQGPQRLPGVQPWMQPPGF